MLLLLPSCTSAPMMADRPGTTDSGTNSGEDSAATTGDSADSGDPADTGAARAPVLADYDNENRESVPRDDGYLHVDSPLLVSRLKSLGANSYAFLLYHSPSDWEDLSEYANQAEPAGLTTWVYLVPPAELPTDYPPYQDDYVGWARAIGELAAAHPSITAIAMDDFDASVFTGSYVCEMMDAAHVAAPALKFYAVDYHPYVLTDFASADDRACVDGVIFPYRDLDDNSEFRSQIDDIAGMREGLSDALTLSYPWDLPSSAGDHGEFTASCAAGTISFRYQDDFPWETAGYHVVRVRQGASLLFDEDVAFTESGDPTVLTVADGTVTIGIEDDLGVSNFGITAYLAEFSAPGCGEWTWTANNADFSGSFADVEGWTNLELFPMIYSTGTSWHEDYPAPATVGEAVDIALQAHDDGVANGVITYCLPKSDTTNGWFTEVQARYQTRSEAR